MILLDTCAIIWDALESKMLSRKAKKAINDVDKQGALLISIREISIYCYLLSVLCDELK